jgi:hypothetical protein
MLWSLRTRPLRFLTSLLAVSLLMATSADAQKKKPPKKKPGATAPARPSHPPEPPPEATPAAPEPAPEPEAEPAKPRKKRKAPVVEETEEKPLEPTEEDKEPEKANDHDKDKASKGPALLDVALGLKGFRRSLAYQGDVNNVLPDYTLSGAPALALEAGIYPINISKGTITAGFTGSFERAFAVGTTYAAPQPGQEGTHTTSAMAYSIGARGNYNFGMTNTIGLGIEYGVLTYTVDLPPPTPENAQVPDVAYNFIRPNLAARFGIAHKLSLLAGVGYMFVSSAGEIVSSAYFRGAITKMAGYDLNLGVGWAPLAGDLKNLEIRPMLAWRHFGYVFSVDPNNIGGMNPDQYAATGAHDDFYSLSLLIGYRM